MDELAGLRRVTSDAAVLGAELDLRFRVLALTVEPREATHPHPDPRLQVLCHPVGEVVASLRRGGPDGVEILTFEAEQLPAVVALFDDGRPAAELFPEARPSRVGWGPRLSLQGASGAGDGRRRHLHLALREGDLALDLHTTFDEVEVRDADGGVVRLD